MKIDILQSHYSFDFESYCELIVKSIPQTDIVGIKYLRFVREFSNKLSNPKSPACYLSNPGGFGSAIEVHVDNLAQASIPEYLLNTHPEIAALFLAEIIGHEVGHHVHGYKRHGLKKKEEEVFAAKYAKAVYFNYLQSRRKQVLAAYTRASRSFLSFDKIGRKKFADSKQELIQWLNANNDGISFP